MQEKTTLKVEQEILGAIANGNPEAIKVLNMYFKNNLKSIQDLLFNYHYEKRERIYDLKIDENSIVIDNHYGSFKVIYMIGFFNACADLDYNAPEKMKIDFIIDEKNSEIILTGEYWPERGQDEI